MILIPYINVWFKQLKLSLLIIARLETRIVELCTYAYVNVYLTEFILNVCVSFYLALRISVGPNDCELFLGMGEFRAKFG